MNPKVSFLEEIVKKTKHTISEFQMIDPGDRVVVAVSGGPDSVCLLFLLHKIRSDLSIELITAHFNHGLRPLEDDLETEFVERFSGTLGIPFVTETASIDLNAEKGPLEETARNARYAFLEKVRKDFLANKIAVGHTLDDQAETVLMRLLRGSGMAGLAGIPPKRDQRIIRPLLAVSRQEVMDFLKTHHLSFMMDSSNSNTRFLRNRIRLTIMPALEGIQPRIIKQMGLTARIMRQEDEYMCIQADQWLLSEATEIHHHEISFSVAAFNQLHRAMQQRVIRQAIYSVAATLRRISARHLDKIQSLTTGSRPQVSVDLPEDVMVKRVYDRMVFKKGKGRAFEDFAAFIERPGTIDLPEAGIRLFLEEMDAGDLPDMETSAQTVFLDAGKITWPLMIRNFRPGDRFIPLGMTGHRKLKDFWIDLKIPLERRKRIPILTRNDQPIWVCGFRIDDRFKITSQTRRVLKAALAPL